MITEINRPKHFSLNVKDVKSGGLYNRVGRSKHCGGYRDFRVGQHLNIPFAIYQTERKTLKRYLMDDQLNDLVC